MTRGMLRLAPSTIKLALAPSITPAARAFEIPKSRSPRNRRNANGSAPIPVARAVAVAAKTIVAGSQQASRHRCTNEVNEPRTARASVKATGALYQPTPMRAPHLYRRSGIASRSCSACRSRCGHVGRVDAVPLCRSRYPTSTRARIESKGSRTMMPLTASARLWSALDLGSCQRRLSVVRRRDAPERPRFRLGRRSR